MDDPLELGASANNISLLDLNRVCWQIELVPETRPESVCITPLGLCKFSSVYNHLPSGFFSVFDKQSVDCVGTFPVAYVDAKAFLSAELEFQLGYSQCI